MRKSETENKTSLVGRRKFLAGMAAAGVGAPAVIVGLGAKAQTAASPVSPGVAPVSGQRTISMGAAEWLTQLTWEKIPQEIGSTSGFPAQPPAHWAKRRQRWPPPYSPLASGA